MSKLRQVYREIINGETEIFYVDESWDEVGAGNVHFITSDGDEITVFNDGGIDHTDQFKPKGGCALDFDALLDHQIDPLMYWDDFTWDDLKILEQRFKEAKRHNNHKER